MKKALVSLLSLLLLIAFDLRSQPPNNQDCLGAVAICQTVFSESNAYSGTGNVPNEINSASSCLGTGEKMMSGIHSQFKRRVPCVLQLHPIYHQMIMIGRFLI